jgi:hypothetical protein
MTNLLKNHSSPSPETVALRLLEYCQSQGFAGWDPYDGLNSRLFKACKALDFKYARLVFIQLLKRSPINLRSLLLIPKEQNPKAIALFLSSIVKLVDLGLIPTDHLVTELTEMLLSLASTQNGHVGWGYNFDWQTRGVLVPRGSPNIICTTFAGNALLDAYSRCQDSRLLDAAANAAKYLMDRLYDELSETESCFNYVLQGKERVHNANLLGAAFLCRVSKATQNQSLIEPALKATRFSTNCQKTDGSWDYGEATIQSWTDNFHTGYNLCALRRIGIEANTSEFEPSIRQGLNFYLRNFFTDDGAPKYFHNKLYPIDIHSVAQSIVTLSTFADVDGVLVRKAVKVAEYAIENMWNNKGYFYYQMLPIFKNRISYMRWSQAWMLFALSHMLILLRDPS